MDYTKAQRQAYLKSNNEAPELTIQALRDLGISEEIIKASTHTIYNKRRIRLVNIDLEFNNTKAIYEYSIDVVTHLQQFRNVGPWSNEHIANSPGTSYRRLDLYLDDKDLDSLLPKVSTNKYELPKVK